MSDNVRVDLHHTHIFASDIDASIDFYRTWFSAEVIWDGSYGHPKRLHEYRQR